MGEEDPQAAPLQPSKPSEDIPLEPSGSQKKEESMEETAAVEKPAETPEETPAATAVIVQEETELLGTLPLTPPVVTESVASSASFKEESYHLRDLKDSHKKSLQEFKAKIRAAIEENSFLEPPKAVAKEESKAKIVEKEEAVKEEEKTEEEEVKEEAPNDAAGSEPVIASDDATQPPTATDEVAREPPPAIDDTTCEPPPAAVDDAVHEFPTATDAAVHQPPVEEVLDDSPPLDDLALWGIPLLYSKGDERTDVLLLKFLRARDFKVEKAMGMLQDTMAWRKDFNTDSLIDEGTPADFHSSFIHDVDREGHPVCYNTDLSSKKSLEDEIQLRKRIQVLEKGIQKLDFRPNGIHSMVQVTDFAGHSSAFLRHGVRSKIPSLLQDNYPELVAKQIFINVPWYLGALLSFNIISPRSKSKIVLARPGKVAETLFKYISPEHVPVQYGGLSRPNDTEFVGVEAPVSEVTVKAGQTLTIELPVAEAGSRVAWDLAVTGWEVVYEEEFVPSDGYTVVIRKANKVLSHEEPIRNTFLAHEPGKIVLTVNNSASRRKRLAVYRHVIKKAVLES